MQPQVPGLRLAREFRQIPGLRQTREFRQFYDLRQGRDGWPERYGRQG